MDVVRRQPAVVLLWALIAAGLVLRVVLGFRTYGVLYDIQSYEAVRRALLDTPLDVYALVNGHPYNRWPYPPGFFAWVVSAHGLAGVAGPFHGWIQMPQVLADCAIAWLVQDYLRARGAGTALRLAAVALVALGPSFWIISGYHGQLDSFAVLPAVAALWIWGRSPAGVRRSLVAGVLIGVGASIKSVPLLMLLALLPSVRSKQELAGLLAPALAIPLVALAPWLVADPDATVEALRSHRALPGFGGITLLLQPSFAEVWLHDERATLNAVNQFLYDRELLVLGPLMAPFVALVFVRRLEPALAAALLWSALVLLNPGWAFHYVVWALPFLLMAGYLRAVAVVQAALFLPAAMLYWDPFGFSPTGLYVAIMIATWCGAVVALAVAALRVARGTAATRAAGPVALSP